MSGKAITAVVATGTASGCTPEATSGPGTGAQRSA